MKAREEFEAMSRVCIDSLWSDSDQGIRIATLSRHWQTNNFPGPLKISKNKIKQLASQSIKTAAWCIKVEFRIFAPGTSTDRPQLMYCCLVVQVVQSVLTHGARTRWVMEVSNRNWNMGSYRDARRTLPNGVDSWCFTPRLPSDCRQKPVWTRHRTWAEFVPGSWLVSD